jgi:predicted nucleic acid-binding protein
VIVVDTSVLIDLVNGRDTVAVRQLERLDRNRTPTLIPAVCVQEVLSRSGAL